VDRKSNMQHLTTMHDASTSSMYEMGQRIETSMHRGQEQNQGNMQMLIRQMAQDQNSTLS
jgi:hypothetical protein